MSEDTVSAGGSAAWEGGTGSERAAASGDASASEGAAASGATASADAVQAERAAKPVRRRQARGEKRIAELLDAAESVFAAQGYAKASTNAIAAAAGASPGTLYQFFKHKQEIAEALMARYVARLREAHGEASKLEVADLPLETMVHRIVEPVVAFDRANPGFYALLTDPHLSPELAGAKRPAQQTMFMRLDAILERRTPALEPERRARIATVAVHLFRGMLPLIMTASEAELPAVVAETERALLAYLDAALAA